MRAKEKISWSERVFVSQRLVYINDTGWLWFRVCLTNDEYSFSIVSSEGLWERHCYKEDIACSVCLCQYLVSVKCYCTLILQENKWPHNFVVNLNVTRSRCVQQKKAKCRSLKLHYCTSPAAPVLWKKARMAVLTSNFGATLWKSRATFGNFWKNNFGSNFLELLEKFVAKA